MQQISSRIALKSFIATNIGLFVLSKIPFVSKFWKKLFRRTKSLDRKGATKHEFLKSPAYDNCELYSPDGILMAKINKKRFEWYLERGLATKIEDNKIQLLFTPKGLGNSNDKFYLSEWKNACVCCNSEEQLTKHHVIPIEYRCHFPLQFKSRSSHEIVLLCVHCHEKYESFAMKKKKQFAQQFHAPLQGAGRTFLKHVGVAKRNAYALLKAKHSMPVSRIKQLEEELNRFLKRDTSQEITEEDLQNISLLKEYEDDNFVTHGELLVQNMKKLVGMDRHDGTIESELKYIQLIEDFCIQWRTHFKETMKPKFLNEHWDTHRTIIRK